MSTIMSQTKTPITYDEIFLKVAVDSFLQQRKGQLISYAYGESDTNDNYVGGGEHWVNLAKERDVYKFPQAHRFLLSNKSGDMAAAILEDTRHDLDNCAWHFISLTPGNDFAAQDALLINSFHQAASANGNGVDIVTIADSNKDFRNNGINTVSSNYFKPRIVAESDHDIFRTSMGTIHNKKILDTKRRTVVIWSGGTVGNVGHKTGEEGFPNEAIIESLQKQVDHSAEECYVVVLHNAFTNAAVLDYYTSEANDRFILSTMNRIKRELPTNDFDPSLFGCKRAYLESDEVVEHNIISTKDQTFFIGDNGFKLKDQQHALVAGYSAQISRDRMGNVSARAGFARVTSFGHRINGNPHAQVIATILKATPDLMSALRRGQPYRSPIAPMAA